MYTKIETKIEKKDKVTKIVDGVILFLKINPANPPPIKIPILNIHILKCYKISKRLDDDISSVFVAYLLNLKNNLDELSMGMSDDYLKACEYKTTFFRIGSKIFGERN